MGRTVYRVTGFFLAFFNFLLGIGSVVILYYAGDAAIKLFHKGTYTDERGRIHARLPTDDWYGMLLMKGWAIGFVYVLPGLTGFTASLFYNKPLMVIHFIVAIFLLFVASFLHTAGVMAIILYRLFVVQGVARYDTLISDCVYYSYDSGVSSYWTDETCMQGRHTLILAIVALGLMLLSWIFNFAHIMFCAITYSNIKKTIKKETSKPKQEIRQVEYPQGTNREASNNSPTSIRRRNTGSHEATEPYPYRIDPRQHNTYNDEARNTNQQYQDHNQPGPSQVHNSEVLNNSSRGSTSLEKNNKQYQYRSKQNMHRPSPKKVSAPKAPEISMDKTEQCTSSEQSALIEPSEHVKDQTTSFQSEGADVAPSTPVDVFVTDNEYFPEPEADASYDNTAFQEPTEQGTSSLINNHDSLEMTERDNQAFQGDNVSD